MSKAPSAAILLIGDELLSGRTRDVNLQQLAQFLEPMGIDIVEARIVSDDRRAIMDALNALRSQYDYVFTTGGIGPTHDDITADSVAAAFGVSIDVRADAMTILEDWYSKSDAQITDARRRMARIPDGASLIANPVSGAPGFQIDNVFVLAGVPKIMRAMLEDVATRLEGGRQTRSVTVAADGLREGDLAEELTEMQSEHRDVSIGSYPYFSETGARGVNLVARSKDEARLMQVHVLLKALVAEKTSSHS